jgi:hypothetical protein
MWMIFILKTWVYLQSLIFNNGMLLSMGVTTWPACMSGFIARFLSSSVTKMSDSTEVADHMHESLTILVLGGYGGTGRVFCRYLLEETTVNVVIAGRKREFSTDAKATNKGLILPLAGMLNYAV